MANFPSVLNSFVRPSATDRLNSPSHSDLHNTVSSALGQVEAVIGVEGNASVAGTIQFILKSPASDGGGHVQSANKGGTGQTSYAKGDILVAQTTSVLTKQAVGIDGTGLVADSTTATGIRWAAITSPKVAVSGSIITISSNSAETSIMSVSIPGSTLGTNGAVKARIFFRDINGTGGPSDITFKSLYGNTSIGTIVVGPVVGPNAGVVNGTIEINLIASNHPSSQIGMMQTDLYGPAPYNPARSVIGGKIYTSYTSQINSDSNQILGLTAKLSNAQPDATFTVTGYTVDKLI
jgi:hypothetical protein